MAIHFEHGIDVAASPQRTFATLDDLQKTPQWLARCTGIESLTPGPNAVGNKLRYSYKEGGRAGVMDGEITARTPDQRLTFKYWDKMMDVTVDFRVAPGEKGTRLVHAIDIAPRTLLARLFSPLIRRQLPSQTITAMETLRGILERPQ
jgi:carbon monoxide dehydrogenase subunit G